MRFAKASLIAFLLATQPSMALQGPSIDGTAAGGNISVEQLESAIAVIEAQEGIGDEDRANAIEQLRAAQLLLQDIAEFEAATLAFREALTSAPAEIESLRAVLAEEAAPIPTLESLGLTNESTLAELEQGLTQSLSDLSAAEARASTLKTQIESQQGRRDEARQRIIELRNIKQENDASISTALPAGVLPQLTEARDMFLEMRSRAQEAETEMLEEELLSHAVRLELAAAQSEIEQRSLIELRRRTEVFRTQVNLRRETRAVDAQQAAAAAELAAADKHPIIRTVAEVNADISAQLPAIAADIETVSRDLGRVETEANELEERLRASQQRLEVGGLSRTIGGLLIEENRRLPRVSEYRSNVRTRGDTLTSIGLAQVRIREQQRELTPLDAGVEKVLAELPGDITDDEIESIRAEVTTLLRDRRELLTQAANTYGSYLRVLGDLDVAQRRLLNSTEEYRAFLDQNLMWIPSAPVIGTGAWTNIGPAVAKVLSPTLWAETAVAAITSVRENPLPAFFAGLLILVLVLLRRPLGKKNKSINEKIGRLEFDNIGLTLAALAITAIRALPVPLLLVFAALALRQSAQDSAFSFSVMSALIGVSSFLYNVLLFRGLTAKNGVARVHFGWSEKHLHAIRRQLDRLIAFAVPLGFTAIMFIQSEVASDRATLGRVAFVALMATLALAIRPLVHPESGVTAAYYNRRPSSWVSKLRWLWFVLATGFPILLAVIALFGYIYAATILTGTLVDTIWLVIAIIVANMVALRWLALTRSKIAWQLAISEREAQRAEKEAESENASEGELPDIDSQPLDLDAVDQQTRKILQSGLFLVAVLAAWGIWTDVIPAFNLLDRVALWSQTVLVDGVETVAPVTLADVLLALVVAAATAIAWNNLPGLMEIVILQRLTLQAGSRYAINTLIRYVVFTVGAVAVLNIVGWNWAQIQWLVAALSVGLGFGLQEIVANFVSGLIILFERPVRVGDTVTVGDLSGKVTRIRIRATTITDWDRKEIIVPNKSFITEQVVNWTLSDPITRVEVPVGISYGSDVELAHKVMGDTLRALPLVLEEPAPKVYFMGFGESSLNFKLYVYSQQLDDRFPLMHAVHEAILKALREHEIEIPFPQRDLHIRSTVENKPE